MSGPIDCDVHPAVPAIAELFDHLPTRWSDYCVEHAVTSLEPALYPPSAYVDGETGADPQRMVAQVLDGPGTEFAVLNCLYGVQPIHNEDWALAMTSALNDWQAARWLAADPRFRASIVVPVQNPARAAEEIDRLAGHPGFVQVLLLAFSETPLGRRHLWPVYEAAQRHGLPVGIHPGVAGPHPLTPVGWPSFAVEDYAAAAGAMQSQLVSLVSEGVFRKFPELRVVLLESGVTWLPSLLWRLDKNWRGLRREIPWVDRPPSEIVREHVRLTVAPFDGPDDGRSVLRLVEQVGTADLLLYASDHPHRHRRDPEQALLRHLSAAEREQVLHTNAAGLYRSPVPAP